MEKNLSAGPVLITIFLVIALCCLGICLVIFASGAAIFTFGDLGNPADPVVIQPSEDGIIGPTPLIPEKPASSEDFIEPSEPYITEIGSGDGAFETLLTLQQAIVPINDPIELAERLGGKADIPETLPDPNVPYRIGDNQDFWVTNVDTNENFLITATLRYLGDNFYIWIENGVNFDQGDLRRLGDTFDNEIYPINREFFGSEWSPGVDHDPRIYMVYAGGLGRSLAGYYSSADQLHPDAHSYSNAHEMFLINADNVDLGEDYIYGTLAHEFQHMIHWYTDKNEETWLNEGFSMLAELINNFDPGGFDYTYIVNTDLQLTDWGTDVGSNGPHYGAAFLFTTYILDRFGEDATKAVVAHDANGMESIDLVLEDLDIRDPLTNQVITAEAFFVDWTIANFLGDQDVADGRYFYSIYPTAPLASPTTSFPTCPTGTSIYDVAQFGVDYLEISCRGEQTVSFKGDTVATILPTEAYSGDYFFWSNMGDHSNMSLARDFDLTDVDGDVTMTYQTWYDLEEDYDYVFVSASTDGERWQILESTSCTTDNPSGNSYGCGLNGKSNGWQEEHVALNEFSGKEVTIRFDYVTDAAVNGMGMAIDDVQIEAIDYFTDFEEDDGGWQAAGFVRIQNKLPQAYKVSLITFGDETVITPFDLDPENQLEFNINIGADVDSVVMVVSGMTPFTREKADYQISIE